MSNEEIHWFLTVDWCRQGKRGLFTDSQGKGYWLTRPHTEDEMFALLGVFDLILSPTSLPFTIENLRVIDLWESLSEYKHHFGIAILPKDVLATVTARAAELLADPAPDQVSRP